MKAQTMNSLQKFEGVPDGVLERIIWGMAVGADMKIFFSIHMCQRKHEPGNRYIRLWPFSVSNDSGHIQFL